MNIRFNILGIIFLTTALMLSDRAFAAYIFVGNSSDFFTSQENTGRGHTTLPVTPSASSLFRDVPSLSGHYSTENMTFLPYISVGFDAGYKSELERTFAPNLQPQQNLNLMNPLGPRMVPNEFQMGIRIPF
jgi:hypothetical protein